MGSSVNKPITVAYFWVTYFGVNKRAMKIRVKITVML